MVDWPVLGGGEGGCDRRGLDLGQGAGGGEGQARQRQGGFEERLVRHLEGTDRRPVRQGAFEERRSSRRQVSSRHQLFRKRGSRQGGCWGTGRRPATI